MYHDSRKSQANRINYKELNAMVKVGKDKRTNMSSKRIFMWFCKDLLAVGI